MENDTSLIEKIVAGMAEKNVFNDVDSGGSKIFPYGLNFERSDILLVCGKNATGKSLFSRYAIRVAKNNGINPIEVSMGERTKKGYMQHAITYGKYGDEDAESTGYTTANRVIKVLSGIEGRDYPSFIVLDEPDIGLSEGYSSAMGKYIAQRANELKGNDKYSGMLVISHNRPLMKALMESLSEKPAKMRIGDDRNFDSWLEQGENECSVEDLLKLKENTKATRRKFKPYMK